MLAHAPTTLVKRGWVQRRARSIPLSPEKGPRKLKSQESVKGRPRPQLLGSARRKGREGAGDSGKRALPTSSGGVVKGGGLLLWRHTIFVGAGNRALREGRSAIGQFHSTLLTRHVEVRRSGVIRKRKVSVSERTELANAVLSARGLF